MNTISKDQIIAAGTELVDMCANMTSNLTSQQARMVIADIKAFRRSVPAELVDDVEVAGYLSTARRMLMNIGSPEQY